MTDYQYATARKPFKEHRTISFNTETSIKPSQQTNLNNQSLTKRKTPSKRYMNISQTQINKTIDLSSFKTHQKTLSLGKQNQFIALPQISVPKNKRGAKKGSFLEIWLNEALDQGQGNQNFLTSVNDQTLGSLRKFGIDRKILKGKNISQQTIDKIYKKLYVYSKGLGMTFQQIGKLASTKSPDENSVQGGGQQIVEIFWKAFSKIMQNETPYESAFQVAEKNYMKTIDIMKEKMRGVDEKFEEMQKSHREERRKLQRQLQVWMSKYKQLQNDFMVTKSTLQLTDKSLQDEVELRLKFQEKINSVYTSYNEMKTKYTSLVEDLNLKKEYSSMQELSGEQLKVQLEMQKTKCSELEHMLGLEREKVRDLQADLVIKREEMSDIERQILLNKQASQKQTDQIVRWTEKCKMLSSLLDQSQIQQNRLKKMLQEKEQVNQKFEKRIDDLSRLNNQLYEEKYEVLRVSENIKQENKSLTKENTLKQNDIQKLNSQLQTLQQQIHSLSRELTHLKAIHHDTVYELEIKSSLLSKANQNIQKLKQVKDRHERLQALAEHQRKQAIQNNITLMNKLQQQELQIQNLRNEVLQKQQSGAIQLSRVNKAKQLQTRRLVQMQEQIEKKDKALLNYLSTIQIHKIQILKLQREMSQLKQRYETRQHYIYQLESQKVLLATNQPLIQGLLKKKQQELNEQSEKNLVSMVNESVMKSRIEEIEKLLKTKQNEIHVEIQCFKRISQMYQQMYEQRKPYVHPMIYQDVLASYQRANQRVKELKDEIVAIHEANEGFKQEFQQMKEQNMKLKEELAKLQSQRSQLKQSVQDLQLKNDKLRKDLKDQISKSLMIQQNENKMKQQISSLINEKTQLHRKLQNATKQVKSLTDKADKLILALDSMQKQKNQLYLSYQQKISELAEIKQQNIELLQFKSKFNTEKSQKSVQTDIASINDTQNHLYPDSNVKKSHKAISLSPNEMTSNPSKMLNLQSKQITQNLLHYSLHPQPKPRQEQQDLNSFLKPTFNQIQTLAQKQKPNLKKVEKGQFKRALKLTFMRR